MNPRWFTLINALGFQACWFSCVLGGSLWGLIAVLLFLSVHLRLAKQKEWWLIAAIVVIGSSADTVFYHLGWLGFPGHEGNIIPAWLFLLWVAFSATLLHSLSFFFQRPLWIAGVSALAAPVSYFAGSSLGALSVSGTGLVAIALFWAGLMGGGSWLASYFQVTPQRG